MEHGVGRPHEIDRPSVARLKPPAWILDAAPEALTALQSGGPENDPQATTSSMEVKAKSGTNSWFRAPGLT